MIFVIAVKVLGMLVANTGNGVFRAMARGDSGKGKRKKMSKIKRRKNSGLKREVHLW